MWQRIKRPLMALMALHVIGFVVGQVIAVLIADGDEDSDEFATAAICFGREFNSRALALRSGSVRIVMGGMKVDLRDATLAPGRSLRDYEVTMGGVEVAVPEGWAVEIDGQSRFGGIDTHLDDHADLPDDAPVLRVRTRMVMGGAMVASRAAESSHTRPGSESG